MVSRYFAVTQTARAIVEVELKGFTYGVTFVGGKVVRTKSSANLDLCLSRVDQGIWREVTEAEVDGILRPDLPATMSDAW